MSLKAVYLGNFPTSRFSGYQKLSDGDVTLSPYSSTKRKENESRGRKTWLAMKG